MRQQVVGAAIDRFLGDDVIALLCKRFNRVADGSCAGGDCQRSRTAFQGGNALFKNILCGICQAAVNIAISPA